MGQQSEGSEQAQDAHNQQISEPSAQVSGAVAETANRDNDEQKADVQQSPSNNIDASEGAERPRRFYHAIHWPAVNAILILAFTLALVIFTKDQAYWGYRQWNATEKQYGIMTEQIAAMKKQIEQTDRTLDIMKLSQRAWLTASVPSDLKITELQPVNCEVAITNSGQTPAFVTIAGVIPDFRPRFDTTEDFLADIKATGKRVSAIIPPSGTWRVPQTKSATVPDEFASIGIINDNLYILGRVVYTDAMEDTAELGFCFKYDPETDTFIMNNEGNYIEYGDNR